MEDSTQNEQEVHTEPEGCWKQGKKAGVGRGAVNQEKLEADKSLEGVGRKTCRSCRAFDFIL